MKPQFPLRPLVLAISIALPLLAGSPAYANPEGMQIIHGSADIQQVGKMLTIKNTPNAIIEWQKFNIAKDEATRFQQESAKSIVLNRVSGVDPSQILGQLSSNGRLFLINRNGLLVGKDARIDTAGFIASTLDIKNDDFLNGRYRFAGEGGKIAVEGVIRSQNGDVFLVSPDIKNSGLIESSNGNVVLAAGKSVEIVSLGLEGVRFTLQAPSDSVINLGQIKGDAIGLFAGTLKHSGEIRAVRAEQVGGKVLLRASDKIETSAGSRIDTNGAVAGQITLDAGPTGTLLASGQISAVGMQGGEVQLLGKHVGLIDHGSVDASGQNAGGTILVGGDYQGKNANIANAQASYTGIDTSLRADAISTGNGGKVIVWADKNTRVNGQISAKGGAEGGNGGLVETSGKEFLDFKAQVDTSAAKGNAGTLLLDPADITIKTTGTTDTSPNGIVNSEYTFSNSSSGSVVLIGDIDSQLSSNNVTIQAEGAITLLNSMSYNKNKNLTLYAKNAYPLTNGIDMNSQSITNSGTGDITLKTDQKAINAAAISTQGNITLEALSLTLNGNITSGSGKSITIKASGQLDLDSAQADSSKMQLGSASIAKLISDNVFLKSESNVSINELVDRSGKNLSIYGKTGIAQTNTNQTGYGYIKANHLSVSTFTPTPSGSISTINLGEASNEISQFSSSSDGSVKLKNTNALSIIAHPDLSSYSKMGGDSWIENTQSISQSAPLTISPSPAPSQTPSPSPAPGSLTIYSTSGNINLNHASNSIEQLSAKTAASAASITIKNNTNINLFNNTTESGPTQSGISTNNGNISLENNGNITFNNNDITAGTGNADILTTAAAKTISIPNSSSNKGVITAANINLRADTIGLSYASSGTNYATLNANSGTINISPFTSGTAFQLGGSSRSALGVTQSEINNFTANTIKIGNSSYQVGAVNIATLDISTSSGAPILDINSSGAITQSGILKTKGLAARASSIALNNTGNVFTNGVALTSSGDINLDYAGNLNIGLSGYADGLAAGNDLSARASSNLTIASSIYAKNATLTATSGSINQSIGTIINASSLNSTANGEISLGQTNQISTLSATNTTGNILIKNSKALTISSLKGNGNIEVNNTADITLNTSLNTASSNTLTLQSENLSQTSGIITASDLKITATGNVLLDKDNLINKASISSKDLTLNNNQALTLGAINSKDSEVKISSKGDLILSDTLLAKTASLTSSNGSIKANNIISANSLKANATSGITLDKNNLIDQATLKTTKGNILLNNAKILTLGDSSADQFKLINSEGLIISGNLTAAQIDINTKNMSDNSTAVLTGNAKLSSTGDIILSNGTHSLTVLSASSNGNISLKNKNSLTLKEISANKAQVNNEGTVTIDAALNATESAKIQSTAAISINNAINSKNINLISDQLNMGDQGKIDATDLIYTPNTADSIKVTLGGNSKTGLGVELSQSDIDRIKASKIILGDAQGNKLSDVQIKGFNAATADLSIISSGSLSQITGGAFIAKSLNAQASSITLAENNTVDNFIPNSNGDIIFSNSKTLALGAISTQGLLRISTQGALGLNDAVTAKNISLKADGGDIISLDKGIINTDTLSATASKGIKLNNSNNINQANLISSDGDISISNNKDLILGKSSSSGKISISTTGGLNINEDLSANAIDITSGGIVNSKAITSTTGGILINATGALNINALTSASDIDIKSAAAINASAQLNTNNGKIRINAIGDLILNDNITANNIDISSATLNSKGIISSKTQSGGNGNILINTTGALNVNTLISANDIDLKSAASVSTNTPLSANNLRINAGADVNLNSDLTANNIIINTGSILNSKGIISAPLLSVKAATGISLDKANRLDQVKLISDNGPIKLSNTKALILDTTSSSGDISIANTGNLLVKDNLSANQIQLKINNGGLSELDGGKINTRKINIEAEAGINLQSSNNTIDLAALSSKGDILLNNNQSIELATITSQGNLNINAIGSLRIADQLQAATINLKAAEIGDTANSQISTTKLQLDGQSQILLDKGSHKIAQLTAKSNGVISIKNNIDLDLQGISTKGNVLIDNQGALNVSAPFSADDSSLSSKGALRINSEKFRSTGTIKLLSRDSGGSSDNIIQNTALIAAGDIKIDANDVFIQNADLVAGASIAQLNQGAQAGVTGTSGQILVDATIIQVAQGVKAISANGGAINYGSARTISNNIRADQIQTTGAINKQGKDPDTRLINKLPITATPEQVDQVIKVIILQNQDQQSHFQQIGTGALPFEAKKPEEIEPSKTPIRIAGEDDANCP
ncbi:filamentous hemagglutinin N-terminal domain-containing protein [Iodobacter sp. CM08]|uniref:two-partner secretion domain-containing protein n=1 Tax=Iodobacter sp. CM08 TaxID=3085902 RepID=UPI002981066A|nr:filamentous hemagglutinin N-terminal domain-containing protein [Iodobacter sp. CM08]MDW5417929.1 filamentous hemagglutinin N-terminal domain-containing protein [Iodobacter sp. CM08]